MSWWSKWLSSLWTPTRRRSQAKRPHLLQRKLTIEPVEPRLYFNASPIVMGLTYAELDEGNDAQGDLFELSFVGGAPGTQLTRIVIDGDQQGNFGNLPEFSAGDVFFDTVEDPNSLGTDHAYPFTVVSIVDSTGRPKEDTTVRAFVEDGGLQLIIELTNFYAGDKLTFMIDVDEVEIYDPRETDISAVNEGLDPIVSGVEMQGAAVVAHFLAPYYFPTEITTTFVNQYDPIFDRVLALAPTHHSLSLPRDDERSNRDRTAGAFAVGVQQPLPVVIRGTVYHDRNANLRHEPELGDHGIEGVVLELYQQDDHGNYHPVVREGVMVTTITDAEGKYEFGERWQLLPGVYEIRERQPVGYPLSVGATVGEVNGALSGRVQSSDAVTDIHIVHGGTVASQYDFAEAIPARLSGFVYHDRNNDGQHQADQEQGIANVRIQLRTIDGQVLMEVATDVDGLFQFDGLTPGVYVLYQLQPDGWIDGLDTPGHVNGLPAQAIVENDRFSGVEFLSAAVGENFAFGERLGSLQGSVYVDRDGNCQQDEHEPPLAGVRIRLRNAQGQEYIAVTDSLGTYRFVDLPAGIYTVIQEQPAGYFNGGQTAGTAGGNTSVANRISHIPIYESSVHLVGYNFCEDLGQLSGYVYHDRNDDGIREPQTEDGIPNVIVHLYDQHGLVATSTTDHSGFYEFSNLSPGIYSLVEVQPTGWQDGKDSIGFLSYDRNHWEEVGHITENDRISGVALIQPDDAFGTVIGKEYNFGEWLPASLAGMVFVDLNVNGILEPGFVLPYSTERERPLQGVTVILRDAQGNVVHRAVTDADGKYEFSLVRPGVYHIEQVQPPEFFDGGVTTGSVGGVAGTNSIGRIGLLAGQVGTDYNFFEHPPATISGYVYQDGPPVIGFTNVALLSIFTLRDGQRTPDDTPIAGVWLELRSGLDGRSIDASEALPGIYAPGPIRVRTDDNGRFEFRGLPRGNYAIYEIHPAEFVDSIDTPGTTSGIALNQHEPVPLGLLSRFAGNPPPPHDAILSIPLSYGQHSEENNFSEVVVQVVPLVPEPPDLPKNTPPVVTTVAMPPPVLLPLVPIVVRREIPLYGASGHVDASWHLSIVDAGYPRGKQPSVVQHTTQWMVWANVDQFWWRQDVQQGRWVRFPGPVAVFGLPGAIPLAGDFNGDGQSEIAIYYRGHWYIDLNGNGRWDPEDLWVALGEENDLPVVGDWNGDGKTDIGIFGPMWALDPVAIQAEPGLPDAENTRIARPKNLPPPPEDATNGLRVLQRSAAAPLRSDLVDHVFRYGVLGDVPIAGDWNGDGICNIGIFRKGTWILDTNADGRLGPEDLVFEFGRDGDVPLVGKFDGGVVPQVAIYRDGNVIIDSNRNYRLDHEDEVLHMHEEGTPVVGDFDGDGKDEIVFYEEIHNEQLSPRTTAVPGENPG